MAPKVGGQLVSVHLPIFNIKLLGILKQQQISKFPIYID